MGITLLAAFHSCVLGDDQVYLIPKGYSGRVLVFFNTPDGQPLRYENRKRVYEIPTNGVLKTQSALNTRWHNPDEFFYYDSSGLRTPIPYVDYRDARQDRVQACCLGTGSAGVAENKPYVEFAEFYVGTKADIDAAFAASEKNPPGVIFQRDGR
jgi:hypothetical protein